MDEHKFLNDYISFHQKPLSRVWDKGNDVLYDMCKAYPEHKNVDEIMAKTWLIGRSYAAAIERRKNKKDSNDNFYVEVANEIIKFGFDEQISKIPSNEKLDEDTIRIIGEVHLYITKKFYQLTKLNKRSLASKYLHFHKPIVPIYDSRAKQAASELINTYRFLKEHKTGRGIRGFHSGDSEFLKFIKKVYGFQKFLLSNNCKYYTVRDIDKYLIETQERKTRRNR